jgi:hypothetical protein
MVSDPKATALANQHGMRIMDVTWEDNGRTKGSSWGPCISDMTLQVETQRLPVIRQPNFEDTTWDVPMEAIPLVVGNEKGGNLHTTTLQDYLKNFRQYLHKPSGWAGSNNSLLAPERDSHVIMSAQACFLPIPQGDETTFNVAIYNYQSTASDPAVLAIVASSRGTSAQVLGAENKLYFNNNGQKCPFVGQRLSDNRKETGKVDVPSDAPMSEEEKQQNMLLIIQVPLKKKQPLMRGGSWGMPPPCPPASGAPPRRVLPTSNVENAVIKVGKSEGEFEEIKGLEIERDPQFPVRVTVQFYKATDNGVMNEENMKEITQQIESSKKFADHVGSLVVDGKTNRPTEHTWKPANSNNASSATSPRNKKNNCKVS